MANSMEVSELMLLYGSRDALGDFIDRGPVAQFHALLDKELAEMGDRANFRKRPLISQSGARR
jgi:hypothetical protein